MRLLLDTSAWARLGAPALTHARRAEIAGWIEAGEVGTCLPFLLEAGYSARSGADHARLTTHLAALPRVPVDEQVTDLALDAQSALARVGHHRVPPSDLVIAACAHVRDTGVLHYDHDFDRIAEHTALRFASVWLAEPGAL